MRYVDRLINWLCRVRPISAHVFVSQISRIWDELRELRNRMSNVDDALVELNDATNEVAGELDALEAVVAGFDTDTAAKIRTAAERLRGLAADPANPVPDAPADGS